MVAEDHVRTDVAHVEGQPRRVLVLGKVIRREAVSQNVMRPFCQAGRLPEVRNDEVIVVTVFRPESSGVARVRTEPGPQIRRHGDQPAASRFAFGGRYVDVASVVTHLLL